MVSGRVGRVGFDPTILANVFPMLEFFEEVRVPVECVMPNSDQSREIAGQIAVGAFVVVTGELIWLRSKS